jgi:hypothetical protein
LENSEGIDPDFPMFTFGNEGKKIAGTNVHTLSKPISNKEEESVYSNNSSSTVNARNSTVEERALNFLRNVGLKQ